MMLPEQYGICNKAAYDAWSDAHQPGRVVADLNNLHRTLAGQTRLNEACLRRASRHRKETLRKGCVTRENAAFDTEDMFYKRMNNPMPTI